MKIGFFGISTRYDEGRDVDACGRNDCVAVERFWECCSFLIHRSMVFTGA